MTRLAAQGVAGFDFIILRPQARRMVDGLGDKLVQGKVGMYRSGFHGRRRGRFAGARQQGRGQRCRYSIWLGSRYLSQMEQGRGGAAHRAGTSGKNVDATPVEPAGSARPSWSRPVGMRRWRELPTV